jgi:hypothetical protein
MGGKLRKCRICKKSLVWKGGDVKNPGPFCKKCYHKKVWPQRMASRKFPADEMGYEPPDISDEHSHPGLDPDYDWRGIHGNNE